MVCMLVALTLAVCWAASASASTWHIKPDGTGDLLTIQAAVTAAAPGDSILLGDGVFNGPGHWLIGNWAIRSGGKDLVIASLSGNPLTCIVDGSPDTSSSPAFLYDGGETQAAVLSGITISNGNGAVGGAIRIGNSSPTVRNCIFHGNQTVGLGGAVSAGGSSAIVEDCLFYDNVCTGCGGGAIVIGGAGPGLTIRRCEFRGNDAPSGLGGAILVSNAVVHLDDCILRQNYARFSGGALSVCCGSNVTMAGCLLVENESFGTAGAIDVSSAMVSIQNCTIASNKASSGGAFRCWLSSSITLVNSVLWGNCASTGSEVFFPYNDGSSIAFQCSIVDTLGFIGPGSITLDLNTVSDDPVFCAPAACGNSLSDGDYSVDSQSPALLQSCGLIGALGRGCGTVALTAETWARIKARYR
jgi:hypothetical protein